MVTAINLSTINFQIQVLKSWQAFYQWIKEFEDTFRVTFIGKVKETVGKNKKQKLNKGKTVKDGSTCFIK